jgi:hypothetical protein
VPLSSKNHVSGKRMNQLLPRALFEEVSSLIAGARARAAAAVNAELSQLYWQIGRAIGREVLGGERAAYGQQIIAALASHLAAVVERIKSVSIA